MTSSDAKQWTAGSALLGAYLVALIPAAFLAMAVAPIAPALVTNVLFFAAQYVFPTGWRAGGSNAWWSLPVWAIAVVTFGFVGRRWSWRRRAWVAALVLIGVTVCLHLTMPLFGFTFELDGP